MTIGGTTPFGEPVWRLVLASSGQVVWWQRQTGPWPIDVNTPPTPRYWYAATKVPCTPYDPTDAKKLVSQSGFSNPTVHLMVRTRTEPTGT